MLESGLYNLPSDFDDPSSEDSSDFGDLLDFMLFKIFLKQQLISRIGWRFENF